MIISRTPFRISFFGGGTDYPDWYRKHGGAVLATTIDKYCYITCRHLPPFFEHKICVAYSKIEHCQSIEDVAHPAVRAVLQHLDLRRGLEIHHDGDLPARSGLGSSSAFVVGLLHALYALKGQMANKRQLASESIHIEQAVLKETVGCQDQILSAYGGLNHIAFLPNGEFAVRPVTLPAERVRELNAHLLLFYTGIKRTASSVAQTYVNGIDDRRRQLRLMKDLVDEGLSILTSGQDLGAFGDLLDEAWQAKRSLSAAVSNSVVDDLYDRARRAGARGGKLIGAGGGGFLVIFAEPGLHPAVSEALHGLIRVPFRFEFSGSEIIFFDREQDYSEAEQARADHVIRPFQELNPSHAGMA